MSSFQQIAQSLLSRSPLPPLCPTKIYSSSHKTEISSLASSSSFYSSSSSSESGGTELSSTKKELLVAALHLANDDLNACHDIVGDMEQEEGKVLHAILHRREGDYWNSKYWINRTHHPLLPPSSAGFVDKCEKVGKGRSKGDVLEKEQWDEMRRVLEWFLEGKKE